jgi:hypothetical protein
MKKKHLKEGFLKIKLPFKINYTYSFDNQRENDPSLLLTKIDQELNINSLQYVI